MKKLEENYDKFLTEFNSDGSSFLLASGKDWHVEWVDKIGVDGLADITVTGGWTSTEGWVSGAPAVELDYDLAVENKAISFGVKPKENSVVIFPAFAPYFHTAHTVKSGVKYMIPGHWIHNTMDLNQSQSM